MSLFGVLIIGYVAWMIFSGVRRSTTPGSSGERASGGINRRPDAWKRMLDALEEAQRQAGRPDRLRAPADRTAVRVRPRVPSAPAPALGTAADPDLDDQAEIVIRKRRAEVERRNRMTAEEGHAAFDATVRQTPASAEGGPATPAPPLDRLRTLFVWREILGPPVGMREDG